MLDSPLLAAALKTSEVLDSPLLAAAPQTSNAPDCLYLTVELKTSETLDSPLLAAAPQTSEVLDSSPLVAEPQTSKAALIDVLHSDQIQHILNFLVLLLLPFSSSLNSCFNNLSTNKKHFLFQFDFKYGNMYLCRMFMYLCGLAMFPIK